jgi:hypothetical protein
MSAFDELRFGAQRTLNLRENLPTASEAVRRAETWLREQQVKGAGEVLVITGRGNQSPGGVGVIRAAVEKLLFSLHRRGVVASHHEQNPGAYVVELAPLRALSEVAGRRREPLQSSPPAPELHGLTRETVALLRDLAERSLDMLGVTSSDARIADEMHRYLRVIAPGLSSGPRMEEQLQQALRAAIAEYD